MIVTNCPNPACGCRLRIEENDRLPGCREMEEVFCPRCRECVMKVFTSGIPTAYVESE